MKIQLRIITRWNDPSGPPYNTLKKIEVNRMQKGNISYIKGLLDSGEKRTGSKQCTPTIKVWRAVTVQQILPTLLFLRGSVIPDYRSKLALITNYCGSMAAQLTLCYLVLATRGAVLILGRLSLSLQSLTTAL
jgi:hypothetical protein